MGRRNDGGNAMSGDLLVVVAAFLMDSEGRVLIAKRPEGRSMSGLWEFPGGKVEKGESPEAALMRELAEELGIEVRPGDLMPSIFASFPYENFHLLMPVFRCRDWRGTPRPLEHAALKWVAPEHLADFPMPPADVPLVAHLMA